MRHPLTLESFLEFAQRQNPQEEIRITDPYTCVAMRYAKHIGFQVPKSVDILQMGLFWYKLFGIASHGSWKAFYGKGTVPGRETDWATVVSWVHHELNFPSPQGHWETSWECFLKQNALEKYSCVQQLLQEENVVKPPMATNILVLFGVQGITKCLPKSQHVEKQQKLLQSVA